MSCGLPRVLTIVLLITALSCVNCVIGAAESLQEIRDRYRAAVVELQNATKNCEIRGHIYEASLNQDKQTTIHLDTNFTVKRQQESVLIEYENERNQFHVMAYSPQTTFSLEGSNRNQLTIRQHTSKPEKLARMKLLTAACALTFMDASFMAYDVAVSQILDEAFCRIDLIEQVADHPDLLRLEFQFLDPEFHQDKGFVVLDSRRRFAIREYEVSNRYGESESKGTLFVRGKIDYPSLTASNSGADEGPIPPELLIPIRVEIKMESISDAGERIRPETWLATDLVPKVGTVTDRDFTLSAYNLPELPPDHLWEATTAQDKWRTNLFLIAANLIILGVLALLWFRRSKPSS